MNPKHIWFALSVLLAVAMLITACQPAPASLSQPPVVPTQPPAPTKAEVAPSIKVALVLSGSINDGSWNAAAYNAINGLKAEYNIDLQYSENVALADIEPTYRDYASKGFDVIIGHGFEFGDPAVKVGKDFPKAKWGVVMGVVEADNVESLNFSEEQTSYLAGYLAASISKTGVIGGIGGEQVPSIIKMMEAYKLGAQAVNPNVKVLITYAGSWTDPNLGMEAANAQVNNKADVLYPAANMTAQGVYQVAKEKHVMTIGSEGNQCAVAPGDVVASTTENIDSVLRIMLESIKNGTYKGATNFYGIKEGGVSFLFCGDIVSKDLQDKVLAVQKQITDGTLNVPVIVEPSK